ncbi:AAA family ATPase [Saccharothrix sp. BKS2]|uniref:helix-turn-helix transcriptional regulator n=1 Tax=Saccharothrix sp. BKS2 TaxID=3064400 RepID=UPI0039EC4DA7
MGLPLVGRAAELDHAREALARALSGRATALLVEGEPGIGKSRLLREVEAGARERGFELFTGSAHELDARRPFRVFTDLRSGDRSGDRLRAALDAVDPTAAGRPATGDESFTVIETIVEWFEERTARTPVALALEDLHWADTSTLTAIGALVRHLADRPLLVVGTLRPVPRRKEVDRLLDRLTAADGKVLRLAGLTPDAAVELLHRALDAEPGAGLRRLAGAAGGNPLFLLELLRALDQRQVLRRAGNQVDTSAGAVPPDLRQTLLLRYSFLPETTLDLLRLMAVLGTSCLAGELAAVSGRQAVDLLTELRPAVATGVVDGSGERLAFRHEMFRQALYEDVPPALRGSLHHEVVRALAAAGAPAARVAEHVEVAGAASPETTAPDAAAWYWRAARECARHSVPSALHWYERALGALPEHDPARPGLVVELAPLLVLSGRVAEAEALAGTVFTTTLDRPARARLAVLVAHALVRQGRWQEAGHRITLAAEQCADPLARDITLGPGAFLRLMTGEVTEAVAQAERSLDAARRAGKAVAEATALMTLTLGAAARGAVDQALVLGREGTATAAPAATSFDGFLIADLCLGVAQADADRLADARATHHRGLADASRSGNASVLPYYQANLAIAELHAGSWDDAATGAGACLALARDTATRWNFHVLAVLARIALARGEPDTAADLVERARTELRACGAVLGADWVLWVEALLLEQRGRPADAAATAARAWDLLPELRFLHTNWMAPPDLVRIALAASDTALAHRVTGDTEAAARRFGTASAAGAALRCRGLVENAPHHSLQAVDAYRDSPRPVELALACEQAGTALAAAGQVDAARPLFHRALDALDERGAVGEARRVHAMMRGHGLRRGPRGRRRPATTGWDSLTRTELVVIRHVAEGLTNTEVAKRLHVSRYTVETHLKHVFVKLDITSRAALAAEFARRG